MSNILMVGAAGVALIILAAGVLAISFVVLLLWDEVWDRHRRR